MVTVAYELRLGDKNGKVVDVANKENPLTFPYGAGMLLPAFETAISDKQIFKASPWKFNTGMPCLNVFCGKHFIQFF
ncbi:MAG: hypothetical protein WCK35_19235 [Chloroflexota bacterium]